jgi:hypothetical protein
MASTEKGVDFMKVDSHKPSAHNVGRWFIVDETDYNFHRYETKIKIK